MKFFAAILVGLTAVSAQRIVIGAPSNHATLIAGQQTEVEIELPVGLYIQPILSIPNILLRISCRQPKKYLSLLESRLVLQGSVHPRPKKWVASSMLEITTHSSTPTIIRDRLNKISLLLYRQI
jgi:hypothetical protein